MKSLLVILLLLNFNNPKSNNGEKVSLDGTWKPVALEIAGSSLPEESFKKQRLTIRDTSYVFVAESVDKGYLTYKDGKMDIWGRDGVNAGKHFTAIFKCEEEGKKAERLTVCYNLKGDKYPDDFSTKGEPGYFMAVFVKE